MDKRKLAGIFTGLALFVFGVIAAYSFRFNSAITENLIALIGLVVLIVMCLILFRSKRIVLLIILGVLLPFVGYISLPVFRETCPQLGVIMLPILVLLSMVFLSIAAFKAFKKAPRDSKRG